MVLSLKIYINPENQNEILVDFVKPFFEHLILTQKNSIFYFIRVLNVDSPHISINFISISDISKVARKLKNEWKNFLKENVNLLKNMDNSVDSIFLRYPQGHIYLKIESSTDNTFINNSMSIISSTNLKILKRLKSIEDSEDILMNAFLVFIYSIGGYSPMKIVEISKLLIDLIDFSDENKAFLITNVKLILNESGGILTNDFSKIFYELCNYYPINAYPSLFSEWKYSYGILQINKPASSNDIILLFKQFKNQLNISDAESYCLLSLIEKVSADI